MIKIAKLSLFVFTLLISQLTQVNADEITVVLHDQQIKQFLAQQGLNFDFQCEMEAADSDDEKTSLITLVKEIFNPGLYRTYVTFPESEKDLDRVLHNELKIPKLKEHDDNDTNQEFFNSLFQASADIHSSIIKSEERSLCLDTLFEAIGAAISSYLCQVDQNSAHLYIKIILDTDTQTITLQAAPNQNQGGFIRTYEKETIENLVAQAEGKTAHKLAQKLQETQRSTFGCFLPVAIPVVVAAISLAVYATCEDDANLQ